MASVLPPALVADLSPDALAALPAAQCDTDQDGNLAWRLPDGRLHRSDGPAVVRVNGHRAWFVAGTPHRLDGPAIEYANGGREWRAHGVKHRVDGPAVELSDGSREWCVEGRLHRADGPAVETPDDECEWWWQGHHVPWALPAALWADTTARKTFEGLARSEQRDAALWLLPTLPVTLQRATVAEALADPDSELRVWGLRAAALVEVESGT